MKPFYLFVVLLVLSCTDKQSVSGVKKLHINEAFFPHSNIHDIDSVNTFDQSACRRMTDQEYYSAFQTEKPNTYVPGHTIAYYYANLGEWNGFDRYIFVKQDTSYTLYSYHVYDQNGKETACRIIGGSSSDEDYYSVFLNDSVIQTTTVHCSYGMDLEGKEIGDCDSTITICYLQKDGLIKEEQKASYKISKGFYDGQIFSVPSLLCDPEIR